MTFPWQKFETHLPRIGHKISFKNSPRTPDNQIRVGALEIYEGKIIFVIIHHVYKTQIFPTSMWQYVDPEADDALAEEDRIITIHLSPEQMSGDSIQYPEETNE